MKEESNETNHAQLEEPIDEPYDADGIEDEINICVTYRLPFYMNVVGVCFLNLLPA